MAATRLLHTDSGTLSNSPPMIGDSHHGKLGPPTTSATSQASASRVCQPCRRQASRHGVASPSRGGDFQSSRQPVSAAKTNWLWNSMRTGASSIE